MVIVASTEKLSLSKCTTWANQACMKIGGPTKVGCQWKLQERSQNGINYMDSWPQIYSLQMAPHHMVWFVLCMCLEL